MKLQHSGQELIPVGLAPTWSFITDPAAIGRCLPEVVSVSVQDATHFEAVVQVGVGPVRGRFRLKFEMQPDAAARRMTMRIAGGGFGSAVDLTAAADVAEQPDGTTRLDWRGEAEMRGPVAAVGGRVLDAQAQKLIAQTFANVRTHLSGQAGVEAP